MSEVRRHHTCPVCEMRFLIAFDGTEPLGEVAVKINCPRGPAGDEIQADSARPACEGYLVTHLPTRYRVRVLPADN